MSIHPNTAAKTTTATLPNMCVSPLFIERTIHSAKVRLENPGSLSYLQKTVLTLAYKDPSNLSMPKLIKQVQISLLKNSPGKIQLAYLQRSDIITLIKTFIESLISANSPSIIIGFRCTCTGSQHSLSVTIPP